MCLCDYMAEFSVMIDLQCSSRCLYIVLHYSPFLRNLVFLQLRHSKRNGA